MTPVQHLNQQQPLQFMQQRPQRTFNEGAAGTAGRVVAIVLTIIAAIVSFLVLPWAAALAVTAGVGLFSFLCCKCCPGQNQRANALEQMAAQQRAGVVGGEVYVPAPAPRWYHRVMPFFFPHRPGGLADPRPREEVGIGQAGFRRGDDGVRYLQPLPLVREVNNRGLLRGLDLAINPDLRERRADQGGLFRGGLFRGLAEDHGRGMAPPGGLRDRGMGGAFERDAVGHAGGGRREEARDLGGAVHAAGPGAAAAAYARGMGDAAAHVRGAGGPLGGGAERDAVGAAGGGRRAG